MKNELPPFKPVSGCPLNSNHDDDLYLHLMVCLLGEDAETFGVMTPPAGVLRAMLAELPAPALRGVIVHAARRLREEK